MKYLDNEEKKLIESIESEEWKPVQNSKELIKKYSKIAANTLKKDKRVNIRLTSKDLEDIKRKAVVNGIPYQTLISSLIHKYNTGMLIEKDK